jgi:hypothetical protein
MNSLPEEVRLDDVMPTIKELLAKGQPVRLYPKGVSMLPMLRQGIDSVLLSPVQGKLKKYDLPLYQRKNGKYVLHRIVKAGETYTCIGDNQYTYESGVRQEQLIAVVTGYYRDEQYRPVNSFWHKFYCRFWHFTRRPRHFVRWLYCGIKSRLTKKVGA